MENKDYLTKNLITYIGNKRKLLGFIHDVVRDNIKDFDKKIDFLDGFAGSGVVSRFFKQYSKVLYSNDFEYYSYVINKCYLSNNLSKKVESHIDYLNKIKLNENEIGFIEEMYSPKDENLIQENDRVFYTKTNAKIIDNIRREIEKIDIGDKSVLIAPLLVKASIHTNTSGVFKGFYKNKNGIGQFGGEARNCLQRIKKDISLDVPIFSNFSCETIVTQNDIGKFIENMDEVDVAYFDPPYNQHPYGSNYFMLNLIAKYEKSIDVSKVSGIPTNWQKSSYNKLKTATIDFNNLMEKVKAKYVLVSYNNEGVIPFESIVAICKKNGKLKVFEKEYDAFKGSRNLKQRSNKVKEIIFFVEK